jgi:hypothetical protein
LRFIAGTYRLTIVSLLYKALYTIAPLLVVFRVIPRTPVMQTGIVFFRAQRSKNHCPCRRRPQRHSVGRDLSVLPRRSQSLTNRLCATERPQCPCNAAESRGSCTYTVCDHLVCSRLASCFLRTSKKFCPFGILCDVPLPGGRQSRAICVQMVLKIPLAPHTPLLLLGTESPSTLWYTAGFSWLRSQQLFRSRAPLHSSYRQ